MARTFLTPQEEREYRRARKEQSRLRKANREWEIKDDTKYFAPFADPYELEKAYLDVDYAFKHVIFDDLPMELLFEEEFIKVVGGVDELFNIVVERQDQLSELAIRSLQSVIIQRVKEIVVPPLIVRGIPSTNKRSQRAMGKIEQIIRQDPVRVGDAYGIIDMKALDQILIDEDSGEERLRREPRHKIDKLSGGDVVATGVTQGRVIRSPRVSRSPYRKAWMILQYGTGQYAKPTRNPGDERGTKAGLPKGRWRWGKPGTGPVIWGQKPTEFLFPIRKSSKRDRSDLEFAARKLGDLFERYLYNAMYSNENIESLE